MNTRLRPHGDPDLQGRQPVFHAGERAMQQRFGVQDLARELQGTVLPWLSAGQARFIVAQPFFFITVLGADGLPLAQVVPRVQVPAGLYPLLVITSVQTFCFMLPDATAAALTAASRRGAGQAGCIFVDFVRRARLRINGRLQQLCDPAAAGFCCPPGHQLMQIDIEQVYANCGARIVSLRPAASGADSCD